MEARCRGHEILTVKYELFVACDDEACHGILAASGADISILRSQLEAFFLAHILCVKPGKKYEIIQTESLQRLLKHSLKIGTEDNRAYVEPGLLAIYDERDCYARHYLRKSGIQRAIIEGLVSEQSAPFRRVQCNGKEEDGRKKDGLQEFIIDFPAEPRAGKIAPLYGLDDNRRAEVPEGSGKHNPQFMGELGVAKNARVLMHNDDMTTMNFVVYILENILHEAARCPKIDVDNAHYGDWLMRYLSH